MMPTSNPTGRPSKYKGVTWDKHHNKWKAQISDYGYKFHLGYFTNEWKAHLAYRSAKLGY